MTPYCAHRNCMRDVPPGRTLCTMCEDAQVPDFDECAMCLVPSLKYPESKLPLGMRQDARHVKRKTENES